MTRRSVDCLVSGGVYDYGRDGEIRRHDTLSAVGMCWY